MFSTFYIVGAKVKSEPGSEDCDSDESPEKGKNLRSAIKKLIFCSTNPVWHVINLTDPFNPRLQLQ